MQKKDLEIAINQSLSDLLRLTGKFCDNKSSSHYKFILSDFQYNKGLNFHELRKFKNKNNKTKIPQDLTSIINFLHKESADLYDVTLYVFYAGKKETIIEVEYFRKSSFDIGYYDKIKDISPSFHSKVAFPIYSKSEGDKFDVNWQHGGLIHFRKSFIFNFKKRKVRNPFQKNTAHKGGM